MQHVGMQFEAAKSTLCRNVEGLTHEESLRAPQGGGNCLNWVVGHLVGSYNSFLPLVGGAPFWDDSTAALYQRGSEGLADGAKAVPLDELMSLLESAHASFMERIGQVGDEQAAQPAPFSPRNDPNETVGSLLHLLAFHQAYHAGQTGVLRRTLGHPGAIS